MKFMPRAALALAGCFASTAWAATGVTATDFASGSDRIDSLYATATGEIIACGRGGPLAGSQNSTAIARYLADGTLDTRYAPGSSVAAGKLALNSGFAIGTGSVCAMRADGGLVVVSGRRMHLVSADGVPDAAIEAASRTVGFENAVTSLSVQADNKVLVTGTGYEYSTSAQRSGYALTRLNADLTVDTGFGSSGYGYLPFGAAPGNVKQALRLADGKVLMLGLSSQEGSNGSAISRLVLVRFNADGSIDSGFGTGGVAISEFTGSRFIEPHGMLLTDSATRLLVVASVVGDFSIGAIQLLRFDVADGKLDNAFGSSGVLELPALQFTNVVPVYQPALQADGKLILPMVSSDPYTGLQPRFRVVRLNADYTLDTSFGQSASGIYEYPPIRGSSIYDGDIAGVAALDGQGRILLGGSTSSSNGDFALARLTAAGLADASFGGDGEPTGNPPGTEDPLDVVSGAFHARSGVCLDTEYVSSTYVVAGLASPLQAKVTGGSGTFYSINGFTVSGTSQTLANGDRVQLYQKSANAALTLATTQLELDGKAYTWELTTAATGAACDSSTTDPGEDDVPDAASFTAVSGAALDTLVESNEITVAGITAPVTVLTENLEYQVNGGAWTSARGSVANGDKIKVRLRSSPQASTERGGGFIFLSQTGPVQTLIFKVTTAAATPTDATPDAYNFPPQTGVEPGSVIVSAPVTISGTDTVAPISIIGGEYSINGGDFDAGNGRIFPGDSVRVRHAASALVSTATTTTLEIGGVTADFVSTTRAAVPVSDTTPDAYSFIDQSGIAPGTLVTSNAITISGINAPTPISVTGGEYRIGDGAFTSLAGTVVNGDVVQVRLTAAAAGARVNTLVEIGGVFDRWEISSIDAPPPVGGSQVALTDANNRTVIVASDVGTLRNVRTVTAPAGQPALASFPAGVFAFEVDNLTPGATVRVTLQLASGIAPNAYYKFGPEAGNSTAHWYRFDFDGSTGAQIDGDSVTLVLQDGGRGDSDATPGRITDPGAPAVLREQPIAANGGGSFGYAGLLLLLPALLRRRRPQA